MDSPLATRAEAHTGVTHKGEIGRGALRDGRRRVKRGTGGGVGDLEE